MAINFREADAADLDVLMTYGQEFHDFDHTEPFDNVAARGAMTHVVSNRSIGRVWLIQEVEEVIGYIVLTLGYRLEYRGQYAFLDELYVRENKRGEGIGTRAIEFLEKTCQQMKVRFLQLEVKRDNSVARALYERKGFEQQDRDVLVRKVPSYMA